MAKAKGRAAQFADPDEDLVKDYDPEGERNVEDDDSQSDISEDVNAGTEHYVNVEKSKLRQKENVSLGPQYRGSRVSRKSLDQDDDQEEEGSEDGDEDEDEDDDGEFDDPDDFDLQADTAAANDSDIDSDDALAESDAEKLDAFVFRGSAKPLKPGSRAKASDFMSGSEEEINDEDEDDITDEDEERGDGLDDLLEGITGADSSSEGDEEEDEEEEDDDDDEGEEEEEEKDKEESDGDDQEGDTSKSSNAAPGLAKLSNQTDVDKGKAIQQQRKAYDALLNVRIRLQKALVAVNTFPTLEEEASSESEPYEAAEEAAIKLLNTISTLRDHLTPPSRTGEKRKRELDNAMTNSEIWEHVQAEDEGAAPLRRITLEKWSRKVQSVNVQAPRGLASRQQKGLLDSLQEQLEAPDSRLLKRTHVPRSCAPAQAAEKMASDEAIYDDADFYQLLLKELVDQRTVETLASSTTALPTVMLTAAKEAKTRKAVDRKASKGRKMRFAVHEKLQNFMASEDRRSWEQDAIDRFLGTLFGRRMELDEAETEEEEDDEDVKAEEGLRLFRS